MGDYVPLKKKFFWARDTWAEQLLCFHLVSKRRHPKIRALLLADLTI